MQKFIQKRALPALWPALIGALLAMGLMLPVCRALEISGVSTGIWACVLAMGCCAVAGMGGKYRLLGIGVGIALLAVMLLGTGTLRNLPGLVTAVFQLIRGNAAPLRVYGREAALLAGFALTVAGWAMAKQSAGFYPALSLTMVTLLIIWFSGHRDVLAMFIPALIALCSMFARSASEETPILRTLLASALAVVLALAVSPALQFQSPSMENFAERLRNYITDTLFFTEPRSVYSIQVDGYKPLETRLGGPAMLEDHPVMTVEAPTSVLLRGTVYNSYTGLNWVDKLSSRRYLYTDPRNRTIRADVMDEQRPPETLRDSSIFQLADIRVTMNANSASTLFVPQRVENLVTPMELVPYFNLSGELFITRDLAAEDTYSFSSPIINAGDSRLGDLIAQAARQGGEQRDMSDYLAVNEEMAQEVYALVARITADASSDYEKARAIQLHLQRSNKYTLSPISPPRDQDFVSYFLLRGKEGYCTYFASAMAMMGRIAGLPTRYVEGYLAEPSGGIALVTSKQAHAWTEVYFDGFGWVAFDATPPQSMGGPRQDSTGEQSEEEANLDEREGGEEPEPTPTPPPQEDDDTNEENDPENTDDPEATPTPEADADPDPTPTPTPSPTPPAPDVPPEDDPPDPPKRASYWWVWLLVIAAIGLLVWRDIWTRPRTVAQRHTSDTGKILTWYRGLLGLLAAADMPARPYETPNTYAARVEQGISPEAGFSDVASVITRIGYGRRSVTPGEVEMAAKCYSAVWRALPMSARIKWAVRRMIYGLGSVRQVP
ncbi:DUF4129 domain-containing protein [Eubacteriales bacterium OttesenSCG-928-A19]|nr:DUF4129 domain-containing protein [Eubacteriales bacterium OttesenSCG-928-A19]